MEVKVIYTVERGNMKYLASALGSFLANGPAEDLLTQRLHFYQRFYVYFISRFKTIHRSNVRFGHN